MKFENVQNSDKTLLVTGATGRQGGAVIRHMLAKEWKLRALPRNQGSHGEARAAAANADSSLAQKRK